jgi:hypothetical protein
MRMCPWAKKVKDYFLGAEPKKTPRSTIKYVMRLQKPSSDGVDKAFTTALLIYHEK